MNDMRPKEEFEKNKGRRVWYLGDAPGTMKQTGYVVGHDDEHIILGFSAKVHTGWPMENKGKLDKIDLKLCSELEVNKFLYANNESIKYLS